MLLEKRDPSTNISKGKDLTLDYQFLTLNQLENLFETLIAEFKTGSYERLSAENCLQAISSTIQLIRTQILASNCHQDNEVGDEIKWKIMNHLKLILSVIPNSKSSEEAIKTISLGFEFFYENPKKRLSSLINCLKQKYRSDLQDDTVKKLNDCIISNISAADQLLTFFESKTEEEFIEVSQFMDLLVDIGAETSASALLEFQNPDNNIVQLIEVSQAALLTMAAKSNSQEWLSTLLKYSKKQFEISTKLIENLLGRYPTGELPDEILSNIINTILGYPFEELLYTLSLIKMDLSSIQILEALQGYLIKANSLKQKPSLLVNTITSKTIIYESKHPYEPSIKKTKIINVPNATKYVLTFDPRSCTVSYYDSLTLRIGDRSEDRVFNSAIDGFPDVTFELNYPFLIFDFESNVSHTTWGWKADIKVFCKVSSYAKQWPATTKEAASILLETMCSSFISGQWDFKSEDEEIVKLFDNPLVKYGIDENALLLTENVISDELKALARIASPKKEKYSDEIKNKALSSRSEIILLENYVISSEEARFNYPSFLQEFIEDSERIKTKWEIVKEKSGVVGLSTTVGGEELDQAERAIFAVYIAYFEAYDAVSNIFDESGDLGETLKYIIKSSNLIRGWAQKYKQKLMDNEKFDLTYADINNDIVKKCKLLLGANYKLALDEIGVNKAMKNLQQNLPKDQTDESEELKTSKTNDTENEDIKEFNKVSNYVTKFLETSIEAEIIIKAIKARKNKAITRSAGLQLLSSMISSNIEQEISIIKVFSDSLKVNGVKRHYWEGLEGVDPKVLNIVQSSFFQLYNLLLMKFTKPQPKNILSTNIYYYLFLLEAISHPFKWFDSLCILKQQFSIVLSQLLKLAKGFFSLEAKTSAELNTKLSRASWYIFKQIFYTIAGNWIKPNQTVKNLVMDSFMQVLFNDLKYGKNLIALKSESFDIKKIISGDNWIGKKVESLNIDKNPVHEWLRQFRMETESFKSFALRDLVNEYVEKVDPSMKGILTQEDLDQVETGIMKTLQICEDNKNCEGYYDFFKHLQSLRELSTEFPENVQIYLSSSILWKYLPYDFYDAQKFYGTTDVKTVIENFALRLRPVEGDSFIKYIELFRSSKYPGFISKDNLPENTPYEFKDKNGNIDFYLLTKAINTNRDKFANIYNEIQDSLAMYSEWPSSCRGMKEVGVENAEYVSSLLWVIYGCLSSKYLPRLLMHDSYVKLLFELTLSSSSEKIITLGARILKYAIEHQKSSDTTFHWFDKIFYTIEGQNIDYVTLILSKIGNGYHWCESEDLKIGKYRLAHEGKALLLSLIETERWRKHVIMVIVGILNSASSISKGEILTSEAIGAISFLASLSKNFDGFGQYPILLENVKLPHISIPKALIKEINNFTATLYVNEDIIINETLDKLKRIDHQDILNIFEIITAEEKNPLSLSLIYLWQKIQDCEDRLDLSGSSQNYAYYRCLYKSLENAILGIIVDILESKEENMDEATKIAKRILRKKTLKPKYLSNAMYLNIQKQLTSKILKAKTDQLTEESAQAKIESFSIENQIYAAELLSLGIPAVQIIKCYDAGITDKHGIINWKEPEEPDKKQFQLYTLTPSNSLITKGNNTSTIYQDKHGNLIIRKLIDSSNEKSEIGIQLDGSIFNSLPTEIDSITILAYLEYKLSDESINCGIKIGDLELGVIKTDELFFIINGKNTEKLNEAEKLSLRVHARASGQVYISVEDYTFEAINASVFNGIRVGNFSIYLKKGKFVNLLGLEIYSDLYKGSLTAEITRPSELEGGEQFVKVFTKLSNLTQKQLALIGMTENFQYNSEGNIDLSASIDYAMENFEADNAKALSLDNDKTVIYDVKIFKSKDKVPKDYTIVKVYEDESPIDFNFADIKILAFKKELNSYKLDIAIESYSSDYEKVGNLSNEENRPCMIFKTRSGLSSIVDIALFKVVNPYNATLPIGFQLICDNDSKAINIAPSNQKSYYLFVGIKRNNYIMNCSVFLRLRSIPYNCSSFGLNKKPIGVKISANKEEDEKNYDGSSILELYNSLYDLEEFRNFIASKKFLLSILKKNPAILTYPEKLKKAIAFIGKGYIQLESSFLLLLKNSKEFGKSSIKEFILQSISTIGPERSEDSLSSKFAIWLLEKLLDAEIDLSVLFSLRVIQPLLLRFLSSYTKLNEKRRTLSVLKLLLKVTNCSNYQIVRFIMSEATELYNKGKEKDTHPILSHLIALLSESSKILPHLSLDKWIIDQNKHEQIVKDLDGVNFNIIIGKEFKPVFDQKAILLYESSHPYERQTKVEKIFIPMASSLSVEFDKESVVEPSDNVYFSYDSEGKNPVHSNIDQIDCVFSDDYQDSLIEIRNNGKTAIMKDFNPWANALLNQTITRGKCKITYKIDECRNIGDHFELGFIKAKDYNELTFTRYEIESKFFGISSWRWENNGHFSSGGKEYPCGSTDDWIRKDDLISFLIDMQMQKIICYNNGVKVHKFTGVKDPIIPIISFQNEDVSISIEKFEIFDALELIGKKVEIKGDTAYIWHPVNIGCLISHQWCKDLNVKLSDGHRTITKIDSSASVHATPYVLKYGKHYIESRINSEGRIGLGFATESSIEAKNAEQSPLIVFSDTEGFTVDDIIGSYIDFEINECKFYKTGELISSKELPILEGYQYVVVFSDSNQSITILESPRIPVEVNIINITSDISNLWGYKFKVTPHFQIKNAQNLDNLLNYGNEEVKALWKENLLKFIQLFKSGAVEQFVEYLNEMTETKELNIMKLKDENIDPSEYELFYYPDLKALSKEDMRQLYKILLIFNKKIEKSLCFFDIHFESYENMTDLQKAILAVKNYIFFRIKNNLFHNNIVKKENLKYKIFTINKHEVNRHRDRKDVDILGQFSLFGQIYRNTISWSNEDFTNGDRLYEFEGMENSTYTRRYETMITICDELQSSYLRLFIPSPNNINHIGENKESWIVNPAAETEQDIELFIFLGKVIGNEIIAWNNFTNLSFPPLFWKRLILEKLTIKDLSGIDIGIAKTLEILRNPEANQLNPDTFSEAYNEKFTTKDSSGREIELIEGGKEIQVTYENAAKYADLIEQYRLNENPKAYNAIRKGMSAVIPVDLINLFSWKHVESLVCGIANVNIEELKCHTDYKDCSKEDQHIKKLWQILKEMMPKERILFLKFVWGRSELPIENDWKHMTICRYDTPGPVDDYLPISHPCDFALELPAYTTKEAMKVKLCYAITHNTDINMAISASNDLKEEE